MRKDSKNFLDNFILIFTFCLLSFPVAVLLAFTFFAEDSYSLGLGSFTLKGVMSVIKNPVWKNSAITSIVVAFSCSAISTFLGLTSALYVYFNNESKLSKVINRIQSIMLVMPDLIVGVVMVFVFTFLKINFGYTTLIISHTTTFSSYSFLLLLSRLKEMNEKVLEAARDLGASMKDIIRHISIPFCKKSLIASFMFSFGMSIDDVAVSYFNSGNEKFPFALQLFNASKLGSLLEIVSASSLFACSIIFVSVAAFLFFNVRKSQTVKIKKLGEEDGI